MSHARWRQDVEMRPVGVFRLQRGIVSAGNVSSEV